MCSGITRWIVLIRGQESSMLHRDTVTLWNSTPTIYRLSMATSPDLLHHRSKPLCTRVPIHQHQPNLKSFL
jgi:hypothetical protein